MKINFYFFVIYILIFYFMYIHFIILTNILLFKPCKRNTSWLQVNILLCISDSDLGLFMYTWCLSRVIITIIYWVSTNKRKNKCNNWTKHINVDDSMLILSEQNIFLSFSSIIAKCIENYKLYITKGCSIFWYKKIHPWIMTWYYTN